MKITKPLSKLFLWLPTTGDAMAGIILLYLGLVGFLGGKVGHQLPTTGINWFWDFGDNQIANWVFFLFGIDLMFFSAKTKRVINNVIRWLWNRIKT